MAQYDFNEKESTRATKTVGIMAVVIVVLVAFGGWLWYDSNSGSPSEFTKKTGQVLNDGAKKAEELANEAKDAVK